LKNIKPEYIVQHVIEAVEHNVEHQTKATKSAIAEKEQKTQDDNK
jgi:hypothetical protein